MKTDTLEILVVEDNVGDVILLKAAMEKAHFACRLHIAEDGLDAMEYLSHARSDPDAPLPSVIVLDLNLPRLGGAEVIRQLLADPSLRVIPLVVLTSSQHERHVLDQWDPRRCLYLIKPPLFQGLVDIVRQIETFLAMLPEPE